VKKEILASLM